MVERLADPGYVEAVSQALSLPPEFLDAARSIQERSKAGHQMGSYSPEMEPTLCQPIITWDKKTKVEGKPPNQEVVVYDVAKVTGWISCGKPDCSYMGREGPRERASFSQSMNGAEKKVSQQASR